MVQADTDAQHPRRGLDVGPSDTTSLRERDLDLARELAFEEAGEEDVPTVVLFIVAGLLLLAFSLYLIVGGGHNHFH